MLVFPLVSHYIAYDLSNVLACIAPSLRMAAARRTIPPHPVEN